MKRLMSLRRAASGRPLAQIAAGDDDAFAAFYRANLDALVAFFRRRVATPELAFDLAAETFAAVIESAATAPNDVDAAAWLYGIAHNKLRDSARRGRVAAEARERLQLEPVTLTDADLDRVEERAAAGGAELERHLADLPELTRRAVLARVVHERSYAEIADELHCSEQVVRQRVHRGLSRLRTTLEEER